MKERTPFLKWVITTQPIRLAFIHIVLPLCGISLATDRPTPPWDIVGWCLTFLPFCGYWLGNYWYWAVRLKHGTVK